VRVCLDDWDAAWGARYYYAVRQEEVVLPAAARVVQEGMRPFM
jgi:hypothetical protein